MKILVTGATGFAGSWICKKLVKEGHEVSILRREKSDISELQGIKLHHLIGDVTDFESTKLAMQNVDYVFHLAGVVGYSKTARQLMERVNVDGTDNVVKACIESDIKRLLHFSSVVAVGAGFTKNDILDENSPYNVGHLNLGYFETKRKAEILVKNAVNNKQLDAVIVNPSTIYGPSDAKKGSRKTQLKVAQGKFKFYTSGGASIISIDDLTEATLQAFHHGQCGERYILSGDNITIKKLFEIIADCAGVKPPSLHLPTPVVHGVGKIGDALEHIGAKGPLNSENAWTSTMYHWFDHSKAKKYLGLNPINAEKAIEQSVRWVKDNGLLD